MFVFIVCYNYTSTTVGITTLVLGKPTPPWESRRTTQSWSIHMQRITLICQS